MLCRYCRIGVAMQREYNTNLGQFFLTGCQINVLYNLSAGESFDQFCDDEKQLNQNNSCHFSNFSIQVSN